jgi:hypothetical protein
MDEASDHGAIKPMGEHERVLCDAVRIRSSSARARRCSLLRLGSPGAQPYSPPYLSRSQAMVVWRTQGSKKGGKVEFFAERVEDPTDN